MTGNMRTPRFRKIEKAQQALDTLGPGSVVLDRFGHAWQYSHGYWYRAYNGETSTHDLAQLEPFTIVHEGRNR